MEQAVKQRLIGALVLALLAFIFLPMLVKGPDRATTDAAQVPIDMPKPDDGDFETRELPLDAPSAPAGSEGVLGLEPATSAPEIQEPQSGTVTVTEQDADSVSVEPAPASQPTPSASNASAPAPTPSVAPPASVTTPEPKKPVPLPAVAAGDWAVNVGSFSSKDSADTLVRKLKADALPVMVERINVNGGTATRVRVGPYADRAVAEAARLRANAVSGGSANIVALDAQPTPATPKPVASTSSTTPKPAPVATTASGWAVQLAALASESDANALRDRARAAGFASFVQKVQTDAGPRFRVRVGPEADKSAADRLRVAVAEKLGIADAVVRPHP